MEYHKTSTFISMRFLRAYITFTRQFYFCFRFAGPTVGLKKYKLKLLDKAISVNAFYVFRINTVNNYNTELGPLSLGANCAEWANRAMLELVHKNSGVFLRSWASYHMRGMCQLERTYFLLMELITPIK